MKRILTAASNLFEVLFDITKRKFSWFINVLIIEYTGVKSKANWHNLVMMKFIQYCAIYILDNYWFRLRNLSISLERLT